MRYARSDISPQVVLEGPLVTFDFVAENIVGRVVSPLNGVTSPDLAWDVHGATSFGRNYGV